MASLKKNLTLFDLTMIAIGSTIGSGIFLTPSITFRALESPLLIMAVWVLGGAMALTGALTYAELGAMMPRAGGVYVFLNEAFGGLVGFLYGWSYFLVANTGSIAALSVAFATYLGYFFPVDATGIKLIAISGIVVVTIINVLGVKAGGIFSDIFTVLKLAGIGLLIVIGIGWGSSHLTTFSTASDLPANLSSAIALAMVGVLWSYGGWQHATFTAAEARDPKRTVPRAMIIAAIAVTAIYLLTILAYMFLLPPDRIASSSRLASDAIAVVLGPVGAGIIALTIFVSTFGTTGIYTLTAPRIYYAMAQDGVFLKKVAQLHPRYATPAIAIIAQSAWAIVLVLFWGTFENLISYVVFTDWIFFGLAGASVFVLRKKRPDAERPYRTLGYPYTSLFFVTVAAWFVVNTLVEKPAQAWAGILFLALGVPVYFYSKRNKGNSESNI